MKDPVRRDNLLTIVGMSLMIAFFLFAVYMPGQKACDEAETQIAAAKKEIQDLPMRTVEFEKLKKKIQDQKNYLNKTEKLAPEESDLQRVIRQVSDLARNSDLVVGPVKPQSEITHSSYVAVPFQLSFTGSFRGIATFLKGLESQERLITVEELSLSGDDERNWGNIAGEMNFSVYIRRTESPDSDENNAS